MSESESHPRIPPPLPEHEWLQQLVGEWDTESVFHMPDMPQDRMVGTETVRSLGGYWTVGESESDMPGGDRGIAIMTLGYDPERGRYVGTWVGSMMGFFWLYDGQLEADGRTLTLESDGPSMSEEGGLAKYRDIIVIKDPNYRVLEAHVQSADGSWKHFMTTHARRKA